MKWLLIFCFLFIGVVLSAQVALDPRYHTYEEIVEEIFALQAAYPDTVMVEQIGMTLGADPYQDPLPIYAVKVSDNVTVDEDEPEILYLGPCHAEEILGIEVNMWMLNELLTYKNVAPFSVWIENLEIWIVPQYNPEGLQVVMDDWDETYRKNKRDNNLNGIFDFEPGSGGDIDGVDPNRNYDFNWIHGNEFGVGSQEEWNDYYRGPAPFSEGETQVIRDFIAQHHFIYSIAWHSSRTGQLSEEVYYSFNWAGVKPCVDFDLHTSIASNVANRILKQGSVGEYYDFSAKTGRYGGANDWFYKAYGNVQLLIECGTQDIQPTNDPPLYLIDDTCVRCSNGAYWLLRRALGYNADAAILTGHITDAVTGDPLQARYLVDEKEEPFFDPRFSDEPYGRFWRPISTGTYTLRINKKGYEEHTETVTVNNSSWTTSNVQLQPLEEATVSGSVLCGSQAVNGQIIVSNSLYIDADTISVSNGSYYFSNYEGEHEIVIIADGYVPQHHILNLVAGANTFDYNLTDEVIIFEDDFEDDLLGWEVTGDWALIESSINGDYSVTDSPDEFYANSSSANLKTVSHIGFSGVSDDLAMIIWHKYQTEHGHDYCKIEYSSNGTSWTEIASFDGYSEGWIRDVIFLPEIANAGGYYYLRFVVESDASIDDPGWWIDDFKIVASVGASSPELPVPLKSELHRNFPNPFNPSTCIQYNLANPGQVELLIYNVKGQKVRTLISESQDAGNKEIVWNGTDDNGNNVSSGIYFYELITGDFSRTRKMMLLK
jgi:hypothetical protein